MTKSEVYDLYYVEFNGTSKRQRLTQMPLILESPIQLHDSRMTTRRESRQNIFLYRRNLHHLLSDKMRFVDDFDSIGFPGGKVNGGHNLYKTSVYFNREAGARTSEYDPEPNSSPNSKSSRLKRPAPEFLLDVLAETRVGVSRAFGVESSNNSLER